MPEPFPPPSDSWHSRARATRRFGELMLLVDGFYSLAFAVYFMAVDHHYPDFFGFWSFARFALQNGFAALYDNRALEAYEYATGLVPPGFFPYPYPPPFMLVLLPFAGLSYLAARLAWIAITGAGFVAAVCAGKNWRRWMLIAALACPTTTIAAAYGQNGFLIAGLMLGGLRCLGTRDFLAGLLFGAITIKPQFFILVPIAIVAFGRWRVFLGAVASAAALVLASASLFGLDMWFAWIAWTRAQFGAISAGWAEQITKSPTVSAAVITAGGGPGLAHIVQILSAVLVAIVLWQRWRAGRGNLGMATRALLPIGTFLATPFALSYDLPIVSGAVLLVIAERARASAGFAFAELLAMGAAILVPALLSPALPMTPILMCATLALLFWQLARHAIDNEVDDITPSRRSKKLEPAP